MMSTHEAVLFILLIGFGVSIVSLEVHARRQARDLALLQEQYREMNSMKGWAVKVNESLMNQAQVNETLYKLATKGENDGL